MMLKQFNALAAASAFLFACGGTVSPSPTGMAAPNDVIVQIQPTSAQSSVGGSVRFAAAVTGTAVTAVTWSVQEGASGGSITTTGQYTSGSAVGTYHVVVTSQADSTKSATATVTVVASPPLAAPSNLAASATSSSGITLTWTNNATSQTGFRIERSSTSATAGFSQVATPGASSTSYNDSGLAASTTYWYRIVAVDGAGDSGFSNVATATTQASGSGAVARPSYNTGTGFFTLNGKLYDANGTEFKPVGINLLHYDAAWAFCTTNCGVSNSGENASRWFAGFTNASAADQTRIQNILKNNKIVSQPVCSHTKGGGDTTNTESTGAGLTALNSCVTAWINAYGTFKPFERYMLLNIANEWGDGTDGSCGVGRTEWRNAYKTAITNLRNAGYLATIVIDTGGSGTDEFCAINHGQALYDHDPQHNIALNWHQYGYTAAESHAAIQALAAAQTATAGAYGGFPVWIGEFGPYGSWGGRTTALQMMQWATESNLGWQAWAWDDGSQPGDTFTILNNPPEGNFSLTNGVPTNCTTGTPCTNASDLSPYGNDIVLNPTYGLFHTRPPKATVF